MKKLFISLSILAITATACKQQTEKFEVISTEEKTEVAPTEEKTTATQFAKEALNQEFHKLEGGTITFQEILAQNKGKAIMIDIWAAWCPDCIKALPEIKTIKADFPTVAFVNLSLDKSQEKWKEAIEKHGIEGQHFYLEDEKRMKGVFGQAIQLNWIPRYILVNQEGEIELFNATEKNFEEIKALLKKIQ